MNNINNIKELLKEEELIIPEIQRDYVWGDNELVIKRFINNIKNMNDNEELDIGFFYSYKIYENFNALIDGQQRITTLILLSWYVGVDNTKLNNFKFKVRENSNNFLAKLLEQKSAEIPAIDGKKFSDKIKNSIWYKRIWDNDPTVKSILNALDIIDKELDNEKENIKNKIDNIKFSCIEAGDRRLETEYILLNKRGVNLTNSEQLKAILTEDIENKNEWLEKWDKDWQDILWECMAEIIVAADKTADVKAAIENTAKEIKEEFATSDADLKCVIDISEGCSAEAVTYEDSIRAVSLIQSLPNGIMRMSQDEMRKRKMTVRDLQDALELDSPQSIYKWLQACIDHGRQKAI